MPKKMSKEEEQYLKTIDSLKIENKALKEKLNDVPKHVQCGYEILKGIRVYGTKEAVQIVKNLKEACDSGVANKKPVSERIAGYKEEGLEPSDANADADEMAESARRDFIEEEGAG